MSKFIGRQRELDSLRRLRKKRTSSLVVVWGRRRIGKSRLIEEFIKLEKVKSYTFAGLAPQAGVTAQDQREEFARQMAAQGVPAVRGDDWGDLFWHLGKHVESGDTIILFDEISWMGSKDPVFLGKLKNAWDLLFKKNPNLVMIFCGSVSTWIEDNIINSTGFFGRFSLYLRLEELPLYRCNEFWGARQDQLSPYEKFKLLAVTGGIPRYLEEIDPSLSSDQNIQNLCFRPEGILVREFDRIFHDLFSRRSHAYKQIVSGLTGGQLDQSSLLVKAGLEKGGAASRYLEDLEKAGFLSRDYSWDIKSAKTSKLSHYRLSDNYLRFYLKWIEPNLAKIKAGLFQEKSVRHIPGWDTVMGLQFENLVLSNRSQLHEKLGIDPHDIVTSGPFFQSSTKLRRGCQIDYLIQTAFGPLYICEVKFSRNVVGMEVVEEVKEKMKRLKIPRHVSLFPVLIHIGAISEAVEDSGFFARTVDFGDLLNPPLSI